MPRIAILDPLTLTGRELTSEIDRAFPEADVHLFHSEDDDEHQIASTGDQPALTPPLNESGDLAEFDVVILAADRAGLRLKALESALESIPELIFIDASPLGLYRHLTFPALGEDGVSPGARLRPAHPSIAVAHAVLRVLDSFGPETMTIAAIEPVSIFGKEGITTLAHQAGQRLQGEKVTRTIDDQIAAFNMTAQPGADLTGDAARLFPELEVVATRTSGGCFHGHVTLLGVTVTDCISRDEAVESLTSIPGAILAEFPMSLGDDDGRGVIRISLPEISLGGHMLSIQAMVDGTQVGGAKTVVSLLEKLQ
jgi:hypothetical protein